MTRLAAQRPTPPSASFTGDRENSSYLRFASFLCASPPLPNLSPLASAPRRVVWPLVLGRRSDSASQNLADPVAYCPLLSYGLARLAAQPPRQK